jgi:hypothetical protein
MIPISLASAVAAALFIASENLGCFLIQQKNVELATPVIAQATWMGTPAIMASQIVFSCSGQYLLGRAMG